MTPLQGYLDRYHVVLVEPQDSLNIGATARAMMNLGFAHLHLVAPRSYDRTLASVTACRAQPILDGLVIHDTFEDAIADREEVVGLSERSGRNPAHHATLPQWTDELSRRNPRRTALVFGPEDNGLRQEHLNQCRWVVRIPSTAAFPSFNLAQSVLLTLYEVAQSVGDVEIASRDLELSVEASPTGNDYQQLDRLVESVMTGSGFLRQGTPEPVPGLVRSMLRRLQPTAQEMGVLLGLFGRVDRALRRGNAGPGGDNSGGQRGASSGD